MVPEGWNLLRLSGMTETITSGSRDWAQYYSENGSIFIRMTNLPRHGIDLKLNDLKYVDVKSNSSDGKRTSLSPGDILISITAELGKIGLVPASLGEAYINQHTALVRLKKKSYFPRYIAYYLSSQPMNHRINRLNDSGAKSGLNLSTIRSFALTIPSLPEQRKIAKILQTWDRAIATTEKLIDASKQQKKALMQQLLTGKQRFAGFEGEWGTIELKECATFLDGKRKPIKQEERAHIQGHFPYYGATGIIDYVNDYIFDDELILLGEDGENILSRSLPHVFVIKGKSWVNNHAHVLKASPGMDTNYLCMYLENLDYKKYNSGSAQPKLNKAICERIPVKVPCLLEQQKIANTISCAENLISTRRLKLTHLKQEKKALMQQLLTGKRRVKVDE